MQVSASHWLALLIAGAGGEERLLPGLQPLLLRRGKGQAFRKKGRKSIDQQTERRIVRRDGETTIASYPLPGFGVDAEQERDVAGDLVVVAIPGHDPSDGGSVRDGDAAAVTRSQGSLSRSQTA